MRCPLVIGNWKMHGIMADAQSLALAINAQVANYSVDVVLSPPFVHISVVSQILTNEGIAWGAQNLSDQDNGAFTGEISGAMLADMGCRYVIVGHSERRRLCGETDALVAAKFMAAQKWSLIPVLCLGESLGQRESGREVEAVTHQLQTVIDQAGVKAFESAVVAYEPIWAIGTGKTATPRQAQAMHAAIRHVLKVSDEAVANNVRVIYGGSVNAANAGALFSQADVDGALVGGASLKASEFAAICACAQDKGHRTQNRKIIQH